MPTDNNGNFSLVAGYLAVAGATIQPSQHNPPLEDIAAGLSARVSRNGSAPMSAPLKHADGTAGAPAVTFNSDPTSGFYKTLAGFAVAIGGVKVAEFLAGGVKGARVIGELVPYVGSTAPALFVLPYGQNLTRAAYPDLWAFAQTEIAAGNSFFNNGDGSITFGIGDLRGRVVAGKDNMGGVSANRLLNGSMASTRHTLGGAGGADTNTLGLGQIPGGITSTGSNSITVALTNGHNGIPTTSTAANVTPVAVQLFGGGPVVPLSTAGTWGGANSMSGTNTINVTSNNTSGGAHDNLQPTIVTNYLMFAGA